MAAFILSQLTSLLRYILVLRAFGTSAEMDAFYVANQVTDTIFALAAGGALASSFIPTFTGLLAKGEKQAAWQLASAIANLILVVVTILGGLAAVFAPFIVSNILARGYAGNPAQLSLTVDLIRLMMPAVVIFGLSGLVMGILNSHQVFLIPALTPSMYSLGLIFGATALSGLGIYGLGWGVLIGAALHLALQLPTLMRQGGRYFPILGLHLPSVQEVGRLFGPRLFGVGILHLNFWVNVTLATNQPDGSVTGIKSAVALMLMPQAAIAQSIATAAMPTLSAQFARGKLDEVRASLAASLRGVLLLSIPASLGLMLLRRPLIVLIYERGAFDARSTDLVSWALLWYAAGLVGHSVVEILARAYYAMHDTRTPVLVGAAAMTLNILFSIVFSALFWRIGWAPHGGLALANSVATALEMVGLILLMRKKLTSLEGRNILQTVIKAGLAALLMSAGLWAWLVYTNDLPVWGVVLGGLVFGGGIYGLAVLSLGVPEAKSLLNVFIRRLNLLVSRR